MASLKIDASGNWIQAAQNDAGPLPPKLATPTTPTFIYIISKGMMLYGASGKVFAMGLWSGHGPAKNDPACVDQKGVGPLPPGMYEYGFARDGGHLGPLVLPLHQVTGKTYGRGGFYIHGASGVHPDMSSDGCIIASRQTRFDMDSYATKVRLLEVRP